MPPYTSSRWLTEEEVAKARKNRAAGLTSMGDQPTPRWLTEEQIAEAKKNRKAGLTSLGDRPTQTTLAAAPSPSPYEPAGPVAGTLRRMPGVGWKDIGEIQSPSGKTLGGAFKELAGGYGEAWRRRGLTGVGQQFGRDIWNMGQALKRGKRYLQYGPQADAGDLQPAPAWVDFNAPRQPRGGLDIAAEAVKGKWAEMMAPPAAAAPAATLETPVGGLREQPVPTGKGGVESQAAGAAPYTGYEQDVNRATGGYRDFVERSQMQARRMGMRPQAAEGAVNPRTGAPYTPAERYDETLAGLQSKLHRTRDSEDRRQIKAQIKDMRETRYTELDVKRQGIELGREQAKVVVEGIKAKASQLVQAMKTATNTISGEFDWNLFGKLVDDLGLGGQSKAAAMSLPQAVQHLKDNPDDEEMKKRLQKFFPKGLPDVS